MKLTQRRIYKSIKKLESEELPTLTVLTGVNGSGKSHLLEAIRDGHVGIDIAPDRVKDIAFYTSQSLIPDDVGLTTITTVHQYRDWFVNEIRNRKTARTNDLLDVLRRYGLDALFSADPWEALAYDQVMLIEAGANEDSAGDLVSELTGFENDLRSAIQQGSRNDPERTSLLDMMSAAGVPFHTIRHGDFDRRGFSQYGRDLFQHSFGRMFFAYFDKMRANRNRRLDEAEGRTPSSPALAEEEFVKAHGAAPWDFVNDTLELAKLDFRIDHPVDYEATEYLPQLTKQSTGTNVQFGSLSSGEKIIMSFALCLYNSTDHRQRIARPKLILFDEIDASLHPSMSRTIVDIIRNILVGRERISVILVTHSPSTVAVSPESSIHLLEPVTNHIIKESKRRAITTLTADIPTLSIDFTGRRQVFVESDYDADRYALLYQILSSSIESERSLTFIGVGRDFEGSGSSKVLSTVTSLADAGNMSVFGPLDWDTKNKQTPRIQVLGANDRYAVENYLLDPVLVAAAVVEMAPERASEVGLTPQNTFASFSDLDNDTLQRAVEVVQSAVLGPGSLSSGTVNVAYRGGQTLSVAGSYLLVNGHDLEEAVLAAFPFLRRVGTGKLLRHMIDVIIRNHPDLVPRRLLQDIEWLCTVEVQ